jgi:putative SOS response-associated peptidase YedK
MTGRFTIADPERIALRFPHPDWPTMHLQPRFNIGPADLVPALWTDAKGRPRLDRMRWGYKPEHLARNRTAPVSIVARAEDVAHSAIWRPALEARRCVVPADGYYEWGTVPGQPGKQPYHLRLKDARPFGFAGLYIFDRGQDPRFALVTVLPNEIAAPIQDRMPAILTPEAEAIWLDRAPVDRAALVALLRPFDPSEMEAFPVVPLVSNVSADGPELLQRS